MELRKKTVLQRLGPGLLYAGAAVGISHLVQSTKAGAFYGFGLLLAVILANLVKYPFFQFGPRYAAATGNHLLHGYKAIGKWTLAVFLVLTLLTMFVIQAAVTIVTAGLVIEMTGIDWPAWLVSLCLLVGCAALLLWGKYQLLDKLMKWIIVILSIATIIALVTALFGEVNRPEPATSFSFGNKDDLVFLIALLGWMPAPMDISVWHSVWSVAKQKKDALAQRVPPALFDFNIGYWGTTLLAVFFVGLGALVLYRTGTPIPKYAGPFAKTLIAAYIKPFDGNIVAYWFIAIAAFTTMLSTTLTCLDAFPRVLTPTIQLLAKGKETPEKSKNSYLIWIAITVFGASGLLFYLYQTQKSMDDLILFITVLSFLLAPVIALFNYLAVTGKSMPDKDKPNRLLRVWSWIGLTLLFGVSCWYFVTLI